MVGKEADNNPTGRACWSLSMDSRQCSAIKIWGSKVSHDASNLHTKQPPHQPSPLPPPPSFLFLYVWTGWVPGSQPLLLLVVPHFLTRIRPPPPPKHTPSLIPSCPWRKTKLARLFNEEQSSERGERAPFSERGERAPILKFSGFHQKAGSSSSTLRLVHRTQNRLGNTSRLQSERTRFNWELCRLS